jgi:hypothetical protein
MLARQGLEYQNGVEALKKWSGAFEKNVDNILRQVTPKHPSKPCVARVSLHG